MSFPDRQISYDSVVLTKDTGCIRGLPFDGDQCETSYDSIVLAIDTGVILIVTNEKLRELN